MLTINEKRWLAQRKGYCNWCSVKFKTDSCFWVITADLCPLYPRQVSTQEAAEFEARVVVKLAKRIHNKPLVCETNWDCPYWPQGKCAWCYLKAARLEVEEEMDGK